MTTAHFGTFDAERWWRPADLAELPAVATGAPVAAMDELLAAFCAPGDVLITRAPMAAALRDGLAAGGITFEHRPVPGAEPVERLITESTVDGCGTVAPYAVLPDTARLAGAALPPVDVVARVNSKAWSTRLAGRLGLAGAGRVVRSVGELRAAVGGAASVVKDPFGVSGRGMLEVGSPGVLAAVCRTLERQERRIELVVQPKYQKRSDFSAHLEIARDGSWTWLGVQVMRNRGFRHIGSGPAPRWLHRMLRAQGYGEVLAAVAESVAAAGYWGPVGVDAMLLADGTVLPLLEINARRSLGLLCLTLDRTVAAPGSNAHLTVLELTVPQRCGITALATALRAAGLAHEPGARRGVLLLGGGRLAAPGGRIHCALLCPPGELPALRGRLFDAVRAAGMAPRGVSRAA